MDYIDMEPEILAYYYKVVLDERGQPTLEKCGAFGADIEVAVGSAVTCNAHEVIGLTVREPQ